MSKVTRHHITIDLVGGLRLSRHELKHCLLRDDGTNYTPDECVEIFKDHLRKGFDVLPACDHHDEKGHCLGHEQADVE